MTELANLDLLVKDFIHITPLPTKKFPRPVGVVLVGPPFSGKTKLAADLAKNLPLAIMSEVSIGSYLAPRATFFKRGTEEVFMLASKAIGELIKQKISIVYDASVKKRADRELLRKIITESGGAVILVSLTLPEKDVYDKLTRANSEILRGDTKGFIMDKDLFSYEVHSIENPGDDERAIVCNAFDSMDREKVRSQVQLLLEQE